jgi:general secretion pathway protein G
LDDNDLYSKGVFMAITINSDAQIKYARAGFPLMEIMIAAMILGLLAGLVGPKVLQYLENSKVTAAKTTVKTLKSAITMYQTNVNQLPVKIKDLIKKPAGDAAKRWQGPYLDKEEEPEDPWGYKYQYKVTTGGKHPYELFSWGSSDGKSTPKEKRIDVWDEK